MNPNNPSVMALRKQVLEALEGPAYRTVHEIPRSWPVLRAHVGEVVRRLHDEGLIERVADPRSGGALPAYRLSPSGVAALVASRNGRRQPSPAVWRAIAPGVNRPRPTATRPAAPAASSGSDRQGRG